MKHGYDALKAEYDTYDALKAEYDTLKAEGDILRRQVSAWNRAAKRRGRRCSIRVLSPLRPIPSAIEDARPGQAETPP